MLAIFLMKEIATCDSPGGGGGAVRTPCPHLEPSMNEELVQLLSEYVHDSRGYSSHVGCRII